MEEAEEEEEEKGEARDETAEVKENGSDELRWEERKVEGWWVR